MQKLTAWAVLAIISGIEVILLYTGYNGQVQAVIMPIVAYLMGIVTKTAVDKGVTLVKKER
jgi:hypothetical protein